MKNVKTRGFFHIIFILLMPEMLHLMETLRHSGRCHCLPVFRELFGAPEHQMGREYDAFGHFVFVSLPLFQVVDQNFGRLHAHLYCGP